MASLAKLNQAGRDTTGTSTDVTSHAQQGAALSEQVPDRNGNKSATTSDPYLRVLLQQLQGEQLQVCNDNSSRAKITSDIPNLENPVARQLGHYGLVGSWRDPQIYLAVASSCKSVPTCYEIADFMSSSVEEEIEVGSNGSHQVVLKSGPKKPKLENITFAHSS